ncbi:hypothetical protein CR513_00305, partial [Mucuna pruriens]
MSCSSLEKEGGMYSTFNFQLKICARYDYLNLIHEKSQSLDVFKSFKAEVELQLGKKIKAVKSDCGGEYYDIYDGSREQRPRPFALFSERCQLKQLTKLLINFGLTKSRISNICTFEVVQLKHGLISRMKENWIQELLVVTLLAMLDPISRSFFETRNVRILEEVEFEKEENIRNVIFEEESVNDIGQVFVPIIVQETTPVIGDNIQTIVPNIIQKQDYDEVLPQTPIEQPQQLQEVSLRRSIRERRHAIPDDCIVFL